MAEERPIRVHLLPSLAPPGALAGGVAVVIDVLRATSTIVQALAAGATSVVPCGEIDEARSIAARSGPPWPPPTLALSMLGGMKSSMGFLRAMGYPRRCVKLGSTRKDGTRRNEGRLHSSFLEL